MLGSRFSRNPVNVRHSSHLPAATVNPSAVFPAQVMWSMVVPLPCVLSAILHEILAQSKKNPQIPVWARLSRFVPPRSRPLRA